MIRLCRCGHPKVKHRLWPRKSDCAARGCHCKRFRRAWPWTRGNRPSVANGAQAWLAGREAAGEEAA